MRKINVYTYEDGEAFRAWLFECGYNESTTGYGGIDDAIFFIYQRSTAQSSFWYGGRERHVPLHTEFDLHDEWYEIQKFVETENKNAPHIIDFIYGYSRA